MRRAITLLEVLISMFVMTVGLLSIASLVPVGKHLQSKGTQVDRASGFGRAAFRDLKARGILDPRNWSRPDAATNAVYDPLSFQRDYDSEYASGSRGDFLPQHPFSYSGTPWAPMPATPSRLWYGPFPFAPINNYSSLIGVVIDPLGVSAGFGVSFPFGSNPSTDASLPRITSGPFGSANASVRAALADSIFRMQDELVMEIPSKPDSLPFQKLESDSRRMSLGNYSWLATVVPSPELTNARNVSSIPCTVSVAVFNKRSLDASTCSERVCKLDTTFGMFQDELTLKLDTADVATQYKGDGTKHLAVAPGSWIMLAGWLDLNGNGTADQWHYKWHRIIRTSTVEQVASGWTRQITVAGGFTDLSGTPIPAANITAFLFDGITAVYEKNMTIEMP